MKKGTGYLLCAALCLIVQTAAEAQITITSSDMSNYFGAGNSLFTYMNHDSIETMNLGTASGSSPQTWTAPAFTILDSSSIAGVAPTATPYSSEFSSATFAQTFSETDSALTISFYAYYMISNDSLYTIGLVEHISGSVSGHAIDSLNVLHQTRLIFRLPISLGAVIAGTPDTTVLSPGFYEVSTSSATIDAYGTLTLPNGSFGALRGTQTSTVKIYSGSTLESSSAGYSIVWYTGEGHQLTVAVDSGATSGTVAVRSISLTYSRPTPTAVDQKPETPSVFSLAQNYPNPFNPSTRINYTLAQTGLVSLRVYDVLGRSVATLVDEKQNPGNYSVNFGAGNMPSGVYYYRLTSGAGSVTKKMLLIK